MTTDMYCTRCGKQFEVGETAIALDVGTIEEHLHTWEDMGFSSNEGNSELLCSDCHTEILRVERPNRVVVDLDTDIEILAERPGEIVVIIPALLGEPLVFGGPSGLPIKQLNSVKEEA